MSRYDDPHLECDLVMKGGITSGVVYPLAICKLAERYRLRSIGGASAGAIAAAAAAAAEYGRQLHLERCRKAQEQGLPPPKLPPGASFEGLEGLPKELGKATSAGVSRLQSFFRPTEEGRPIFELALAFLGRAPWWARLPAVLQAAGEVAPASFLLALLLVPLFCWIGQRASHPVATTALVVSLLALWAVLLGVAAVLLALRANRALGPENGYGLCPGFHPDQPPSEPGLTRWLADLVDRLAGRPVDGPPLTIRELEQQKIEFQAMTTSLTHGRPYRLPFEQNADWFFRRSEIERLFPRRVVDFLVEKARARVDLPKNNRLKQIFDKANEDRSEEYFPLPAEKDLPLIVAARMSLSFPVLIQAVPLYKVDWTLKANRQGRLQLERCWFTDGGACSNLPLHFFDSLLPSRPTFALNLRGPHEDHPVVPGQPERRHVWIPHRNGDGAAERWNRFEGGKVPIGRFLLTLLDTMQSWNDQLTAKYPGYRDRVVHIHHTDEEGGLNLDMPAEVIERLAQRGAAAGEALREKFDPEAGGLGWQNHLWVRYRVRLATLTEEAKAFEQLGDQLHGELLQLIDHPPGYRLTRAQRHALDPVNQQLVELAAALRNAGLGHRAPNPPTRLKARPTSG